MDMPFVFLVGETEAQWYNDEAKTATPTSLPFAVAANDCIENTFGGEMHLLFVLLWKRGSLH